jgi:hypothetical protein
MARLDSHPAGHFIIQNSSKQYPKKATKACEMFTTGGPAFSDAFFILAINPLHRLIELAAHTGLLHPILPRAATLRCSLYADDAAIFANPERNELHHISQILNIFGKCSGLKVNLNKIEIFPIRCDETTAREVLLDFPGKIGKFPGNYLGLPLHTRQLRRVDVQPLLDKIGGRILGWKGKLLSMAAGKHWSNVCCHHNRSTTSRCSRYKNGC